MLSNEVENPVALPNLEDTTPFEDLKALFRNPKIFFEALARSPRPLSNWLLLKSLMGLCCLTWFVGYFRGMREIEKGFRELLPFLEQMGQEWAVRFPWLSEGLLGTEVRSKFAVLTASAFQLVFVIKPFLLLFFLLFSATTVYFFLPWVGVPKSRRSFGVIYLAGVYAHWYGLVGLIPGVGPFLAWIAEFAFYILAIQWIHRISFWKSFLATYLIGWFLVGLMTLVGAVFFMILLNLLISSA